MWPFNKNEKLKKQRAIDGKQIPGMENDPRDNGVPNIIYNLDDIEKELKEYEEWKKNSED